MPKTTEANGRAAEPKQAKNRLTNTATKKICVCGRAPSSLHLIPWDDPDCEFWGLSNAASLGQFKNWHRWFEIHPIDENAKRHWPKKYWDWLHSKQQGPIMIREADPTVPSGEVYPWEHILAKYGRYHNNSVSLMIALALEQPDIKQLHLYGVDMAQCDPAIHQGNPEYQHQRPSCEYMIGWACCQLGLENVFIPLESDLCKSARIYGLEGYNNHLRRKCIARKHELDQRLANMKIDLDQAENDRWQNETQCAKLEGQMEELRRLINALGDGCPPEIKQRLAEVEKMQKDVFGRVKVLRYQHKQIQAACHKFDGALEDDVYWMNKLDA